MRRDIAVLRQTYSSMSSDFTGAMSEIRAKAANVKSIAVVAATPSYEGDAGRAALASAERFSLMNQPQMALASAQAAMGVLAANTPDWIRAQDIAMTARNAVESDKKKK